MKNKEDLARRRSVSNDPIPKDYEISASDKTSIKNKR